MSGLRVFEAIEPGEILHAGPILVTREAIFAFAQMYDPQPFHLDERAASASLLGGLAASGWHTTAVGMRLFHDGFVGKIASMGSPGVDEVRWVRPVRPGDALSLVLTIGETRVSKSKRDRGFVATSFELHNAAGETVMTQRCSVIVRRDGGQDPEPVVSPHTAGAPFQGVPPDISMLAAAYDEIEIGQEAILGTQAFTPELIVGFAKIYDPQYFHLDAEAAQRSHFGGLCASGWQTAAFWMKHYVAARRRAAETREAAGRPVAFGGPSPGFSNLKWLRPVHAGSAVTYRTAITGKRRVTRPGWALVTTSNTGAMPDGTIVFSFDGKLLWPTGA